ncbi:MAG: Ig-like domain-containing protein, partial [Planctomycetaceae bacterium]
MTLRNWLPVVLLRILHPARRSRRLRRARAASPLVAGLERLEDRVLLSATTGRELLFSVGDGATATDLPDVGPVAAADIVRYDGSSFSLIFDADDVGLGAAIIDAFAFQSDTELLMSFATPVEIAGIGTVGPSDVVLFTASSLGETTHGTFTPFFDGGNHLPSGPAGNIDAMELLDDGSLLVSTAGDVTVTNPSTGMAVKAQDEDVLQFSFALGGATGEWSLYFDGSAAELTVSTEDIDGFAVADDGHQFLSTLGGFFVQGIGGSSQDVIEFVPTALGENTAGSYLHPLLFDGSAVHGPLARLNVNAIDVGELLNQNQPPIAHSQQIAIDEDVPVQLQLLGDDGDPSQDQMLNFVLLAGPLHGVLNFDPQTGRAIYVPSAHYNGTDSFSFAVVEINPDGSIGLASETATVSIHIAAINDAPMNHDPMQEQVGDTNVPLLIHGLSVADLDAYEADGRVQVTLSAATGTLSLDPAALGVGTVEGNGSRFVTLRGLLHDINA